MKFKELIETVKKDLNTTKRAITLIQTFTPNYLLHSFLFAFDVEAAQYIGYYLAAEITDEVTGGKDIKKMAIMVAIMVISELVLILLSKYSWRRIRVNEIISQQWEEIYLNNKSFSMDYKNMEDPEIRAKRQAIVDNRNLGGLGYLVTRMSYIMNNLINIVFSIIMVADMFFRHSENTSDGIVAFADSWVASLILFIVILISCVFSFVSAHYAESNDYVINKKISATKKIYSYYLGDYLDDSKACKDVHIFNQKELINDVSERIHSGWLSLIKEKISFYNTILI